jgi:hypothetical protein
MAISQDHRVVALTYANDRHRDGAGAQLQRIYGIFALARFLHLPYFHSPLLEVGNHGLAALENNVKLANVESSYNQIFLLKSDIECPSDSIVHYLEKADLDYIENIKKEAESSGKFHLIRILYPYAVTDQNPEIYDCLKSVSPFVYCRGDLFKIAIHIRRGDLLVADSNRMLPNSYYVSCVLGLTQVLKKMNVKFACEIYTEVPSKTCTITPHHQGDIQITSDVQISPEMSSLDDFRVIPNLAEIKAIEPIETLRRMATADALILSRSSFSYLAALFNPAGSIIYYPFWHSPMKDWLVSDQNGSVPQEAFMKQIKRWKQNRPRSRWVQWVRSFGPKSA